MKCYCFVLLETPKTGASSIGCDPRNSSLTRGTRGTVAKQKVPTGSEEKGCVNSFGDREMRDKK